MEKGIVEIDMHQDRLSMHAGNHQTEKPCEYSRSGSEAERHGSKLIDGTEKGKSQIPPETTVNQNVEIRILEIYARRPFCGSKSANDGARCLHFEMIYHEVSVQSAEVDDGTPASRFLCNQEEAGIKSGVARSGYNFYSRFGQQV